MILTSILTFVQRYQAKRMDPQSVRGRRGGVRGEKIPNSTW